jgi:hypothetical protein
MKESNRKRVFTLKELRLRVSIFRMSKFMNKLTDRGLIELTIYEMLLEHKLNTMTNG